MTRKRRRRCRYYVNSNFVIGLVEGRVESIEFANRYHGLCTGSLVFIEARLKGRDPRPLIMACRNHGIRVVKLTTKTLALLRAAARKRVRQMGLSSRHIVDLMHMLLAKRLHAVFVTADKATCKRAKDLGIDCTYLPDWWRSVVQELERDKRGGKRSEGDDRETGGASRESRQRRR